MNLESVNGNFFQGSLPEAPEDGALDPAAIAPAKDDQACVAVSPSGACVRGPAACDVEDIVQLYLAQLREESKTAGAVAQIRKKLIEMEGNKVIAKMEEQADKIMASGIFQGVVSIASSIATAVSAGVGVAASAGANAATSVSSQAASSAAGVAGNVAQSAAAATAGQIAKTIAIKAGPELIKAAGSCDVWKLDAERVDVERQKAANRKEQEEMSRKMAADHLDQVRQSQRRVMQLMERADQLKEEGMKIAASSLRG